MLPLYELMTQFVAQNLETGAPLPTCWGDPGGKKA
ncbi:hypothetical protein SAMN05421665_0685 [Yoonia rosea]|uniref:Uncharacterized protein n=1 Tax=Yoonia rosea TaxID=287098 RepID=A0A1R3WJB6_9RHOB|nr:hypothetical protein SAMN05421665_0685 [Yoonia rosea]